MAGGENGEREHQEALESLLLSGIARRPSALAVIVELILREFEAIAPGAVDEMIERLEQRLTADVVILRQKPVSSAVVESRRAALAWLRAVAPTIPGRTAAAVERRKAKGKGKGKKTIKAPRHGDRR